MNYSSFNCGVCCLSLIMLSNIAGCQPQTQRATPVTRRVLMFPGVANVRFHLTRCVERLEHTYPGTDVDVRLWGWPLLGIPNLMAYQRNRAVATDFAEELAAFSHDHPDARIDIVGYSGGGGMAVFVVEALPEGVQIDRLILIAAALSPDYPISQKVLPHVREGVICFASTRDLQVGWGTRHFGTMDRQRTVSAGYRGLDCAAARVLNVHWDALARGTGHRGNHLGYLSSGWQSHYLIPALDPAIDLPALRERFGSAIPDTATGP